VGRACLVILLGAARPGTVGALGQVPPPRPADARQADRRAAVEQPEDRLWQDIRALTQSAPATQPYDAWFAAAERRLATLLAQVESYLTLYPGGTHRDEAIRLQLASLYELGTLRGGNLDPLRQRVAEYLRAPPSDAALHEAAYWEILCRRTAATQTTSAPAAAPDADLVGAYRTYIERYPRSRYVPRLATLVFEDALRRGDRAAMRAIVELLKQHFPDHAATATLAAQENRTEAVGRPFWLAAVTVDGRALDTRQYVGSPVLIVVWADFDAAARNCVQRIEEFRTAHPDLRVVGVALDDGAERTAAASRSLNLDWPQFNDRLGWGGEFARTWGVRRIPMVFAIDREGRLAGSTGDEGWEKLAVQVLRTSPK